MQNAFPNFVIHTGYNNHQIPDGHFQRLTNNKKQVILALALLSLTYDPLDTW